MHVMQRTVLSSAILSALVLSSCGFGSSTKTEGEVHTAKQGAAAAVLMAGKNMLTNSPVARPSSVLGVFASMFLSANATPEVHTALVGVEAQLALYFSQQADTSAFSATIEQLGTTLQVDITDMLNRSSDRVKSLDEYLSFLEQAMKEATAVRDNLKGQGKELDKQLSDARSTVSGLRQELSKAIANKDFALAGGKQELLGVAEAKVAELAAKRDQISSNVSLIEKLLDIAVERQTAITNNRQVLIAGLSVVNVPGVTDLGLLRTLKRR